MKNLKISFRNLFRDRFYTVINGVGLAVGMAAALLIFIWANDELTFDDFHEKSDDIYRIVSEWPGRDDIGPIALTPLPFADAAREQVPEVAKIVRTWWLRGATIDHFDERIAVDNIHLVDKEFFDVFDFEFINGNKETAFNQPNNIVITSALAKRIFGTTDAIGQPLKAYGEHELLVSGIMADVPSNSHIKFDALIPLRENIITFGGRWVDTWTSFNFDTYALVRPGVNISNTEKKLSATFPPKKEDQIDNAQFKLQPLKEVYLHSDHIKYSTAPQGDLSNIRMIAIIGLLILLIASINYVNMSTARSSHRSKAVGVRKIVGASRFSIFFQFFTEAFLLIGIASIIALSLANMGLSFFENLTGKTFAENQLWSIETGVIILGTALIAIVFSGIQPALQLSNFKPLETLRGNNFNGTPGKSGLRKVLVTCQFACSGALIIGTLVMLGQMDYVKKEKLGYEREHIFTFSIDDAKPLQILNALKGQPGVLEVSASNQQITNIGNRYMGFEYEGKDPDFTPFLRLINPDENFKDFFGLELKEGRWLRPGNEDYEGFILNETAIKEFGIKDPIGSMATFNGNEAPIIGIVKDFHYRPLQHKIEPMIFAQDPSWFRQIYVKTNGKSTTEALASAEKIFSDMEPNALFDYQFLDESYEQLYESETKSSQLFLFFAALAIFISCLGVLGLATYSAERRSKEIGIRKILGASVSGIVGLLSKEFIKPVLLAMLIASPIAYYFMDSWLSNFAYRISLSGWTFTLATIIVLLIAFTTVSLQSMRAAMSNPVDSLRNE